MAVEFEKLKFTRDWNSSADFPTYEENEQKVRADMQALHDETKEFINEKLIPGIENMAVPGTGDMKAEVYDPQNKRKDVYQYAEDKIAETVETHLEEANHVDAYSKEETLSAETREVFGLAEDATPNDAFSKIASVPDVVMDANTGKKYTVKAGVKHWAVQSDWRTTLTPGTADPAGSSRILFSNDALVFARGNKLSNGVPTFGLQYCNRGEVPSDAVSKTDSSTTSAMYANYFNYHPNLSVDNALCNGYSFIQGVVIDAKTGTAIENSSSKVGGREYGGYFNTENKWGYHDNQVIKIYSRGTSAPYESVNVSAAGYPVYFCALDGDMIYVSSFNGKTLSLSRVNLLEKTCAAKLYTFDFASVLPSGSFLAYPAFSSGVFAYFSVYVTSGNPAVYSTASRLLRVNVQTGESNLSDFSASDFPEAVSKLTYCNPRNYIGTVGNTAYFWEGAVMYQVDKDTGVVSFYNVDIAREGSESSGHNNVYETVFDIKGLPGVILCDAWMFDTNTGIFSPIKAPDVVTSGPAVQSALANYGVVFGGTTVADTTILAANSYSTILGGKPTYDVEYLEEFEEEA